MLNADAKKVTAGGKILTAYNPFKGTRLQKISNYPFKGDVIWNVIFQGI